MCFLIRNQSKDGEMGMSSNEKCGAVKGGGTVPDVPCEVFAPAEDHATFAKSSALKGLCWSRTIAFGYTRVGSGWGTIRRLGSAGGGVRLLRVVVHAG